MRWAMKSHKLLVGVAVVVLLGYMTFFSRCTTHDATNTDSNFYREVAGRTSAAEDMQNLNAKVPWQHLNGLPSDQQDAYSINYTPIDCVINGEYSVECRRENSEVYVPFNFLAKYFEVYGKMRKVQGEEQFEWKHSYSRVYEPEGKYSPEGIFMSFEHYNVEVRDRVKCISGMEGVPISTQWGPEYYYPIQIAQYGLSHYSKYLIAPETARLVLEDAESGDTARWLVHSHEASVHNVYDHTKASRLVEFSSSDSLKNNAITFSVNENSNFFLSFDFKFVTNGSITVVLEPKGKNVDPVYIHYVCSRTLISYDGTNIYYGIGNRHQWTRIYRDLSIDFQKGVMLKSRKKSKKVNIHRVRTVVFRGHGFVDNITLSDNAHLAQFYYAANWLVSNQDDKGGWPIMVKRSLANGVLELDPGWYSAMAQGQAMSTLVRAYIRTKSPKYLKAALKATELYDVPSAEGGVLAKFADKYSWYEEYPTTPPSFVLNGFIYSLIGLYDLRIVAPTKESYIADRLYTTGIESLKALLPLFDTGSGTIYDLRHFVLGSAPNLARWDYHATHINQLLLLSTIEDEPIFETTAKRWASYMKGKRAAHN